MPSHIEAKQGLTCYHKYADQNFGRILQGMSKGTKFNSFETKLGIILSLQSFIILTLFVSVSVYYAKLALQNQEQIQKQQSQYFFKTLIESETVKVQSEIKAFLYETKLRESAYGRLNTLTLQVQLTKLPTSDTVLVLNEQGQILNSNKSQITTNTAFDSTIFKNSVLSGKASRAYFGHMLKIAQLSEQNNSKKVFTVAALKIQTINQPTYYLVVLKNIDNQINKLLNTYNFKIQPKNDYLAFEQDNVQLKEDASQIMYFLLVLFLGSVVLIAVSTNYFSYYLTSPVRLFLAGIKSYSETGYGYKIQLETNDEFSKLADAFNSMIESSRLSLIDPMTNLFNRRYLDSELVKCCQTARRKNDNNLSVAVFDIDFFKKINDQHGHAVGDEAIKFLAECLKLKFRTSDVIARFGGEEFVVILKDSSLEGAFEVSNRVRAYVEEQSFISQTNGKKINLTISCGVANAVQVDYNPSLLFDLADQALLKSKQSGRNQVTQNTVVTAKAKPHLKVAS